MGKYTWEIATCRFHKSEYEYYTDPARCIRCYYPTPDMFCEVCLTELKGKSPHIPDNRIFVEYIIKMFENRGRVDTSGPKVNYEKWIKELKNGDQAAGLFCGRPNAGGVEEPTARSVA